MLPNRKNLINLAGVALLFAVLACSCPSKLREIADNSKTATPVPTPVSSRTPRPASTPAGEYDLTMEKYEQIKVGSTRTQVESILGGRGSEISSSTGGGMKFSVNKWAGEDFKSIILSFRNDKVLTKSQVGLE